ncbi:MAG: hypothetical protein LBL59_08730 [Xanthomonadaceae bacterium]|jgi:hypothetical protein|nr:hypothetical protein [Xanthomonadaceae bacterium]
MAVTDDELVPVGPWPQGINNLAKDGHTPPGSLREAVNVDLDRDGWIRRSSGYQRIMPGHATHSLWSDPRLPFGLYVDDGVLHVLHQDEAQESLGIEVGGLPVSYCLINDRVFFTNRLTCGLIGLDLQPLAWAPEQPAGQPQLSLLDGFALDPGQYQVAVTFTDLLGRESGTTVAAVIDVPEGGGIHLEHIPQPLQLAQINVYLTGPNDQVLKLHSRHPPGTLVLDIGEPAVGYPLATQHLQPLPPGQIVRYGNGRQWVAAGRELLWSEPLRYGLFNSHRNRIRFAADIELMQPMGDGGDGFGVFVAAGKRTFWLGGTDPINFSNNLVLGAGAVPGSDSMVPGAALGLESSMPLLVWLARNGWFCIGFPGGQVMPLKQGQAVVDDADRAAMLFREQDGMQQVIAALMAPQKQGLMITDRASAEIVRRGCRQE